MAKLHIGIGYGDYKTPQGKSSRSSSVNYLYCYNDKNKSADLLKFKKQQYKNFYTVDEKGDIEYKDGFLFALNYTSTEPIPSTSVSGVSIPPPDGIVTTSLQYPPQRSVYKREVWRDAKNQIYYEKILHPVSLQNNLSRIIDYNVSTNRNYEYIIYLTDKGQSGGAVVKEIHFPITTKWEYWTISELHKTTDENVYTTSENETWLFKFNVEPGEQQQNISKSQQDTLGQFPAFSYGKKNYITSSVSCLLGAEMLPFDYLTMNYVLVRDDDGNVSWALKANANDYYGGYTESRWKKLLDQCGMNEKVINVFDAKITSNDSVDMLNEWRKVCNSGNPKLYKNSKGQAFIIQITESSYSINESWDKQPITINFSWTEIAKADNAQIIQTTGFTTDVSGNTSGGGDEPVLDYNALANKPSINGVTLVGDKTDQDLYLEAEGNVEQITGTTPNIVLNNNMTYNLGTITGLTTEYGTINDEYYKNRQCSQAEINFVAGSDFVYEPPANTTLIGEDVQNNKLNAKSGTSYNIGFGYVDNVMYAVSGIK